MPTDKQFAISGRWALASDPLQWILQRTGGGRWHAVSFVRSTRAVLARCMREKGCPPADAERLLAGLPDIFDEWRGASRLEACSSASDDQGIPQGAPALDACSTPPNGLAKPAGEPDDFVRRLTSDFSTGRLGAARFHRPT